VTDSPIALDPVMVASAVLTALQQSLGPQLTSVVAHGSWVHGDFEPYRSDVDLVAVLDRDPTTATVEELGPRLQQMFHDHPGWTDRVEIGLVTAAAVRDTVAGIGQHQVGRLSPGEPLHLVPADLHRALDWDAAHRGRTIHGPADLLPEVPADIVHDVLINTLAQWPGWVEDHHGDALAYAVLTVCRADAYASTGRPYSKRAGARWLVERRPDLAGVITAAEHDWYQVDDRRRLDAAAARDFVRRYAGQRASELRTGRDG
jgi:predicted nucleotidyltransferase